MLIKSILRDIREYLRLKRFQEKYLKLRGNNSTQAGNIFPMNKVSVGDYTYGTLFVHYYKQPEEYLRIGKYCSIANNVQFFTGGGHDFSHITSYPFKNRVSKNQIQEATTKGPIEIEDDVWIGSDSIILSGVKIGKGAVIGAGSVVAKDIPAYGIYCGDHLRKMRFDNAVIEKLKSFDVASINYEKANELFELLYTPINVENVDEIIDAILEKRN